MIRRKFIVLVLILAGCATQRTQQKTSGGAGAPGGGVATTFALRPHAFETLPNGLTILWVDDQSLPYVSVEMMVKSGYAQDPVGREGLAQMTAAMLEKGTLRRGASRVANDLEQMGSDFKFEVSADYTLLQTSMLSTTRDEVLDQFREIVLTPAFLPNEIERHRANTQANLSRLPDEANAFAQYVFPNFLYGPTHAYGHSPIGTGLGVKAITRDDLRTFYAGHFVPANAVLAVTGQYDEAFQRRVRSQFGAWAGKPVVEKKVADFPEWSGIQSRLVDRGDLNQAQVLIGTKGISRDVPDYMALRLGMKVLGEGFGSRLFEEIRVKRGLTYGIGSFVDAREKAGPAGISTFTRLDKIGELVTEVLRTYRDFLANGSTDGEVDLVKAQMSSQFIRLFETADGAAAQLLILNRYGIGEDYLTNHMSNLAKLTTAQVNDAVRAHVSPNDLRILVYAPAAAAKPVLEPLGPVEVRNYRSF